MAEQRHGGIDVTEQQKTVAGFVGIVACATVAIPGILLSFTTRI